MVAGQEVAFDGPWPRISVVTPSYNQGEYIEETIRSVLLQQYPNLEYFVMDGGSGDATREVIGRYADHLTGWVSEPDEGQTDAILKGFQQATGEILCWINSDDRLAPGALLRVAAAANRFPDAGLIHARCSYIGSDGEALPSSAGRDFDLLETIRGNNSVAQSSAFFRRSAYEAAGGLDVSLHYVMDMDLWLRLGLVTDVVFIDDSWSEFRRHEESKTGQGDLAFALEIYSQAIRAFEELDLPETALRERRTILANLALRVAYRSYQVGDDLQARRYARMAARHDARAVLAPGKIGTLARVVLGRRFIQRLKGEAAHS
jgi:glycosyltransferase involved in cell wall biosynthesis